MFQFAATAKILARSEQTFHEEGRLHQVPAVVKHAEDGECFARLTIHEVGPGAVIAGSLLKEIYDLHQPLGSFLASDEPAVHADDEGHDAETGGTGSHDPVIAGNAFAYGAGNGMGAAFPVVAETGFLQHGKQISVLQRPGGGTR